MFVFLAALVLVVPQTAAPATQERGAATTRAPLTDQDLAVARAWFERAIGDIDARSSQAPEHFDPTRVARGATEKFRDAARIDEVFPMRARERLARASVRMWCRSDSFVELRAVGGRIRGDLVEMSVWDDDAREPWTITLARDDERERWAIVDVCHEPSGWTLQWSLAGGFVKALERVLELGDSDRAIAVLVRARAEAAAWDFDLIPSILEELDGLELDPGRVVAARALAAIVRIERGDLADLDAELALVEDDPAGARAVALGLVEAGSFERALSALERRIEDRPDDPIVLSALATVLADAGRLPRALGLVERAGEITRWAEEELLAYDEIGGEGAEELVLARFLTGSGADGAFEPLVSRWLGDGRYDAAERLIGLRRASAPDDPNIAYYGAWILRAQDEPAQAAMLLFQAFPAAREIDELPYFHAAFVDAMDEAGKGLEGYRLAERSRAAFDALADAQFERSDWDALLALCDEHEQSGEEDVELDLWRMRARVALGEHDRVIPLARAARERAWSEEDDATAGECDDALLEALFAVGGWERAYEEFDVPARAFQPVARRLARERRPEELASLLARHMERVPDALHPAEAVSWQCEIVFLRDDADVALAEFDRRREEICALDLDWPLRYWEGRVTRLCVRTGDLERAGAIASAVEERTGETFELALVALARGEAAEARACLSRALRHGWSPSSLLEDGDVARLLAEEAMAPVRAWLEGIATRE